MTQHKPVNWSLPLWTKEEKPRKVTLKPGKTFLENYPRGAHIENGGSAEYTEDGRYYTERPDPLDLQNLPAPAEAPFDWAKPFTTRDGRKAEEVDRAGNGDRLVRYRDCEGKMIERWHTPDGRYLGPNRERDLINIPEITHFAPLPHLAEPAAPPAIDWSLPVETCEDPPVQIRILCTDGPGDYPVIGLRHGKVRRWRLSGTPAAIPVRNVPPEPARHTVWVNVYLEGTVIRSTIWWNKQNADEHNRHCADTYGRRIACFEHTFTEGDGL